MLCASSMRSDGPQFALGRDAHASADCVDDLQGEEEPLEQGAQSVQTGIRRQLLRRQIRVVGHVIKVRHAHPRAKPDIGRTISGKQSVQVAMPDLGALLELCKLVGGPCDQFVAPAGEPDSLAALRHRCASPHGSGQDRSNPRGRAPPTDRCRYPAGPRHAGSCPALPRTADVRRTPLAMPPPASGFQPPRSIIVKTPLN